MAGLKTDGWTYFDNADITYEQIKSEFTGGQFETDKELWMLSIGLQGTNLGLERSFQELYERMQRLHQKIDRIEKKIGSV